MYISILVLDLFCYYCYHCYILNAVIESFELFWSIYLSCSRERSHFDLLLSHRVKHMKLLLTNFKHTRHYWSILVQWTFQFVRMKCNTFSKRLIIIHERLLERVLFSYISTRIYIIYVLKFKKSISPMSGRCNLNFLKLHLYKYKCANFAEGFFQVAIYFNFHK